MGQDICATPLSSELYLHNKQQIDQIVLQKAAAHHIQEKYPSLRKAAEKQMEGLLEGELKSIDREVVKSEEKMNDIREQVKLRLGGEQELELRVGTSLKSFLSYDADMKRFKEFKSQAQSEFARKEAFLLVTIQRQKDCYINAQHRSAPDCPAYEELHKQKQQAIDKSVESLLSNQIERNNKQAYEKFERWLGVTELSINLTNLQSTAQAQSYQNNITSRWQRLLNNIA